jgi:hypothetical protein
MGGKSIYLIRRCRFLPSSLLSTFPRFFSLLIVEVIQIIHLPLPALLMLILFPFLLFQPALSWDPNLTVVVHKLLRIRMLVLVWTPSSKHRVSQELGACGYLRLLTKEVQSSPARTTYAPKDRTHRRSFTPPS